MGRERREDDESSETRGNAMDHDTIYTILLLYLLYERERKSEREREIPLSFQDLLFEERSHQE